MVMVTEEPSQTAALREHSRPPPTDGRSVKQEISDAWSNFSRDRQTRSCRGSHAQPGHAVRVDSGTALRERRCTRFLCAFVLVLQCILGLGVGEAGGGVIEGFGMVMKGGKEGLVRMPERLQYSLAGTVRGKIPPPLSKLRSPLQAWTALSIPPLNLKEWAGGLVSCVQEKLCEATASGAHIPLSNEALKSHIRCARTQLESKHGTNLVASLCEIRTNGGIHSSKGTRPKVCDAKTEIEGEAELGEERGSVEDIKWSDVVAWKLLVAGTSLLRQLKEVSVQTWLDGWTHGVRSVRPGSLASSILPHELHKIASGVKGGVRRFYTGISFSVLNQIPSNAFYLVTYQWIKECLERYTPVGRTEDGNPGAALLASSITEMGCTLFDVPHDIVTQRLQMQPAAVPFKSTWKTPTKGTQELAKILRSEGTKGLYSSTRLHLLTYLPWSATWWTTYEMGKVSLTKLGRPFNITGPPVNIAAGCLAGLAAAAVANPIDVLKTRMQTDPLLKGQGIGLVARRIIEREGVTSMFKGLAVAILFDIAVSAGGGYRYDWVMRFARKRPAIEARTEASL